MILTLLKPYTSLLLFDLADADSGMIFSLSIPHSVFYLRIAAVPASVVKSIIGKKTHTLFITNCH